MRNDLIKIIPMETPDRPNPQQIEETGEEQLSIVYTQGELSTQKQFSQDSSSSRTDQGSLAPRVLDQRFSKYTWLDLANSIVGYCT